MYPPRPNILAFLSLITTSLASNVYYPPADSLLTCSVEEGYADCPSGKLAGGADDEYSLTIGDCGCKAFRLIGLLSVSLWLRKARMWISTREIIVMGSICGAFLIQVLSSGVGGSLLDRIVSTLPVEGGNYRSGVGGGGTLSGNG